MCSMSIHNKDESSSSLDIKRLQSTIMTQLVGSIAGMQHIDELLQRLAFAIVQRFGVQLTQFWTNQINDKGQTTIQLRTLVRQDPSLPEHIVVNDHIAKVTVQRASERSSSQIQPVESVFSPFQSSTLKRYGLHYCISYFLARNVLLPPPSKVLSPGSVPSLFAMTTWIFLQYNPHWELAPTIGTILEQAATIAASHGLLLPVTAQPDPLPAPAISSQQEVIFVLAELIPQRRQDDHLLLSSNPFASPPVISDKKAARLYAAINGRSSVADLCKATNMEMEEVYVALQILLSQQRIEMYNPTNGQLVNASRLFRRQ